LYAGVLLLAAVGVTGGCSLISKFSHRGASPVLPQQAVPVVSRVDSLFNSSLPADTLFLTERTGGEAAGLLPEVAPLRLGPSSAMVFGQDIVWGWRVQLASSSDKKVLESIISQVEREFDSPAYLVDLDGYWALRIGAFDNLESASRERDRAVSYGYKAAWIVQTGIPPHQIQREE